MTSLTFGQNYSADARKIAMGGGSDSGNLANKLIEQRRSYRSIPIPLGLIQLVRDRGRFNPNNDEFDPVLALEYAANPLHFTVNRGTGGGSFIRDLENGDLNRQRGNWLPRG
jgi:hypothetical protein